MIIALLLLYIFQNLTLNVNMTWENIFDKMLKFEEIVTVLEAGEVIRLASLSPRLAQYRSSSRIGPTKILCKKIQKKKTEAMDPSVPVKVKKI